MKLGFILDKKMHGVDRSLGDLDKVNTFRQRLKAGKIAIRRVQQQQALPGLDVHLAQEWVVGHVVSSN
jgi:K+/H+ antiporter YhaU regulatory subunit KhtT